MEEESEWGGGSGGRIQPESDCNCCSVTCYNFSSVRLCFSPRPWRWSMVTIYGKRTVMRKQAWCFSVLNTGRWHMMHLLLHLAGDRQCAWPLTCSLMTPTWLTLPAVWQVSVFFGLSLSVSTVIQYAHQKPVLLKVSNE